MSYEEALDATANEELTALRDHVTELQDQVQEYVKQLEVARYVHIHVCMCVCVCVLCV